MTDSSTRAVAALPPWLSRLNAPQREAVETLEGPVLVLAGAGTGKTSALTARLAWLLASGTARPGEILAVTFTNKAAREMRERTTSLIRRPVEGWWLGTFHSLAARMLRRVAEQVGLNSDFTILDPDDQQRLVRQLLEAEGIDAKKWPPRLLLGQIDRWKDRALTPDKLKPEDGGDLAAGRAVALYAAYQARLRTLNACDFGDLLLHLISLWQRDRQALEAQRQRFRYLLVDEYQDTNVAQYLWLRLLAGGHRNLCCVGDDDQSIYGWRGAEIGNILKFEKDFPGAKVIRLEQNYRSTGHILNAASALIAHNAGRLGKTLWTGDDPGEKVRIQGVWDGEAEARHVSDGIESLRRDGHALNQIAVLVRAAHQMREFEDRFVAIGLPYRVVGGPRFYERLEIRDALAYLQILVQPAYDLSLERIINVPKRKIGASSLKTLQQAARALGLPLYETATRLIETDELPKQARSSLAMLIRDFERWRAQLATVPHAELARIVLDESGYTAHWQAQKTPDAAGRLENLKSLTDAIGEFETLPAFLEHVSLVMEAQNEAGGDMVSIMTLHGAKGTEFDTVWLAGWEDGLFPNQRALEETGTAGLEEERRLAHVGLTRARRRATITHAAQRLLFGQWMTQLPSRFIDELPDEDVITDSDVIAEAPGGFDGWSGAGDWHRARNCYTPPPPRRIETVPQRSRPAQPYSVGERVFHRKFGYGTIREVESEKLTIAFDHGEAKKVMDSFVVPAAQAS